MVGAAKGTGSLRAQALQPDRRGSNAGSVVYVSYVIIVMRAWAACLSFLTCKRGK